MLELAGKTAVIVIADGYYEHEFWYPYYRFQEAGAQVIVAGIKPGIVYGEGRHGTDGLPAQVTHSVEDAARMPFHTLFLPGGIYGPLALRDHQPTLQLVRSAMQKKLIVASICHGPWILVSAGVLKGKKVTCPTDMADDVKNAGAIYVREKCVRDGNLFTAEYYACLPELFRELIPALTASYDDLQ